MDLTIPPTGERERTTRTIALGLLWTFIGAFAFLIVASLWIETRDSKDPELGQWFDLLKNAFILISTALTTLIGYYFGQHESARAHARADEADTKRREAEEKLAVCAGLDTTKATESSIQNNADGRKARPRSNDTTDAPVAISAPGTDAVS